MPCTRLFTEARGSFELCQRSRGGSRSHGAAATHAGAFRQPAEAAVTDRAKRKIPVHLVVGTRDPFFPANVVRFNRDYLAKKGFPIELEEISGHDHDYYGIAGRINREAWAFLSDKQLRGTPRSKFQDE